MTKNVRRDLLARAYLDMLAAEAGMNSRPLLRSGRKDDPAEKLIDDLSVAPNSVGRTAIRADLAAAAVLTARSIESVEGLTRDLRMGSPVVSIATNSADVVALVRKVVKICAFGKDAVVLDEMRFDDDTRPVLLIARDGTGKDHQSDSGNDAIAKALHACAPIVGIAPEPRRHLPRDLLRAAEHNISLPRMDPSAISLVVEAVTGAVPESEIDKELARGVDVSDLALSVRADRTAKDCIGRLESIVSNKKLFDHEGPSLDELHGYGAARAWGLELAADLNLYRRGELGDRGSIESSLDWDSIESSLLLVGPPGVGKTQYASALAKSCNVPLIKTSVASWNSSKYLSGTLSAIKDSFNQARQLAPSILFIDELDGLGDRAEIQGEHREYWVQILNLTLEQLSSVPSGVIVICCTNYPERIDPAIRRAGRLDRTIEIGLPDAESLVAIFRFYLGPDVLREADLTSVALAAVGHTGADVQTWVRRARSRARRARRPITVDDLLQEVRSGRDGLPENLRRVCAVHEAGHLIVGVALDVFEPQALSILDHGGATRVELSRANTQTMAGIENYITSLLAGRAAEEVILGSANVTVGSGIGDTSDFARATEAATDLELRYGFGVLGVAQFSDRVRDLLLHDASIIGLVKERLDRCMRRARDLIEANRDAVEVAADRLERTGYLDRKAIDAVLSTYTLKVVGFPPSPMRPG